MSDKLSDEIVERALEAYLLELQTNPRNMEAARNSPTWPRVARAMQFGAMREALLAASPAPAISESEDARDAARYRWLRSQPNNTETPRIDVVQWSEIDESANEGHGLRLDELDAAIDAARARGKS